MEEKFVRTGSLLGEENMGRLKEKHIAVFGVGGVGGYAVEALVRSGIGEITIIDKDEVAESDINRQIIATVKTIGRKKVEVMAERIHEIQPDCVVHARDCFYLPDTAEQFDFSEYDYVVDAIDTVTAKLALVMQAQEVPVPVISCMGAGNKLDASQFEVADIYETSVCPLARVMRRELKRRKVKHLKVVYSREEPRIPYCGADVFAQTAGKEGQRSAETQKSHSETVPRQSGEAAGWQGRRSAPGSVAFVPSVAGLLLAGEVIRDLVGV